jgi:hypothetical protein
LINISHQWLGDHDNVKWNNIEKVWTFPNGNRLSFGYLASSNDKYRYQGGEYSAILIDEASQIHEDDLKYMHSRLRKSNELKFPLTYVLASNPGNISNDFLRDTYVNGPELFIPFTIYDNPFLNTDEYFAQLEYLSPEEKQYMKYGNFDYVQGAELLITESEAKENIIRSEDIDNNDRIYSVVGIDFAADGADRTAVVVVSYFDSGIIVVENINTLNGSSIEGELNTLITKLITEYNINEIIIEEEPGSSGLYSYKYWYSVLSEGNDNIRFRRFRPHKSKFERSRGFIGSVRNGMTKLLESNNIFTLINEMVQIHPDKKVMRKIGSPDILDATDMAWDHINKKFNKRGPSLGFIRNLI